MCSVTSGQDGVYNVILVCSSIPLDKDLGFGVSTKSFSTGRKKSISTTG